jgi:hypothetical protein
MGPFLDIEHTRRERQVGSRFIRTALSLRPELCGEVSQPMIAAIQRLGRPPIYKVSGAEKNP